MNENGPKRTLDEELSLLPRQAAPEAFTRNVLAELDRRGITPTRSTAVSRWATLLAAVAVLSGLGYAFQQQRAAERAYRAQVDELRSSYQQLLNEAATIRRDMEDPGALVYLAGDDSIDLVLDLSQPTDTLPDPLSRTGGITPANFRP